MSQSVSLWGGKVRKAEADQKLLLPSLIEQADVRPLSVILALALVDLVILGTLIWDMLDYGFETAQIFYFFELLMFVAAYFFVSTSESKSWYLADNS